MTGLIDELSEAVDIEIGSILLLLESEPGQRLQAAIQDKLSVLAEIGKSGAIEEIIESERVLMVTELNELLTSHGQESSLSTGLKLMEEATKSLERLRDEGEYAVSADLFSSKDKDGEGLPKDAFRKFLESHRARLSNRFKTTNLKEEVEVLEQRIANLNIANRMYKDLQRSVLDQAHQDQEGGLRP